MKYVTRTLTDRPYPGSRDRTEYEIRVPQFSSLTELRREFSIAEILKLINDAIAFKFTSKARAYMNESGQHPQELVWLFEAQGIHDTMFPQPKNHPTITYEMLKEVKSIDDLISNLKSRGIEFK